MDELHIKELEWLAWIYQQHGNQAKAEELAQSVNGIRARKQILNDDMTAFSKRGEENEEDSNPGS